MRTAEWPILSRWHEPSSRRMIQRILLTEYLIITNRYLLKNLLNYLLFGSCSWNYRCGFSLISILICWFLSSKVSLARTACPLLDSITLGYIRDEPIIRTSINWWKTLVISNSLTSWNIERLRVMQVTDRPTGKPASWLTTDRPTKWLTAFSH